MAQTDSRRLHMVLSYLHPDLNNKPTVNGEWKPEQCDYYMENNSDGKGTQFVWQRDDIPKPTDQQIADAKEDAVNAHWLKMLRWQRNELLVASDWSQGTDVPSALKNSYATYRAELRDLPTTVVKPSFETLNNQSVNKWYEDIWNLMPTKPGDN